MLQLLVSCKWGVCGGLKNTFKSPNRCQSFHEEEWVMGALLLQDNAGEQVRLSLGSQSLLQRGSISSWNSCQTANGCFSLGHCALLILLLCLWTQSDISIWCSSLWWICHTHTRCLVTYNGTSVSPWCVLLSLLQL